MHQPTEAELAEAERTAVALGYDPQQFRSDVARYAASRPAHQFRGAVAAVPRSTVAMTDVERVAVSRGWNLENFRSAVTALGAGPAPVVVPVDEAIPPPPDMYAAVRAARGVPAPVARVATTAAEQLTVPAPPDLFAAVRAARR